MRNIAICYGSYYKYLKPGKHHLLYEYVVDTLDPNTQFIDGEFAVDFKDSIRGKHVFIFGDTADPRNQIELEWNIDAAIRASAAEITVILPYYGYARQDKKGDGRGNMAAATIARKLERMGVTRLVSIDLHAHQIQGFFWGPFEHLSGRHLFEDYLKDMIEASGHSDWILASPDAGGTVRVQKYANKLFLPYVICDKRRDKPGSIGEMRLIGDVKGLHVIMIDDILDSGGTLVKANKLLKDEGALSVTNLITHPVMSAGAYEKLAKENINLITSNTRNAVVGKKCPTYTVIDCSEILHKAIINISENRSVLTTLTQ
jgi:ribose-phosphate pyrophosphokinase